MSIKDRQHLVNVSDLQQKYNKLLAKEYDTFRTLQKDFNYLGGWSTQLVGVHLVVAPNEAVVG